MNGEKDQALAAQEEQLAQKSKIQNLTWVLKPFVTLFFCIIFTILERIKKINTQLHIKNKENELLLKEIHHRVKNNLQTISSLLSLQSESISDKSAFDAIQESKTALLLYFTPPKLYQGKTRLLRCATILKQLKSDHR